MPRTTKKAEIAYIDKPKTPRKNELNNFAKLKSKLNKMGEKISNKVTPNLYLELFLLFIDIDLFLYIAKATPKVNIILVIFNN